MGNYDSYDFEGLSDYEIELAKGYIDMGEINSNMAEEYNSASNEGLVLGVLWARDRF